MSSPDLLVGGIKRYSKVSDDGKNFEICEFALQPTFKDYYSASRNIQNKGEDEKVRFLYAILSVCIPDGCKPSDLFGDLGIDGSCYVEGTELNTGDIAFL